MAFTPTPACYADPDDLKSGLGQKPSDAASADVRRACCEGATTKIVETTGRIWCLADDAEPQTLTYDAPLANTLQVHDLVSVDGVTVQVAGEDVDPAAYVWQARTIYGYAPHYYAVRLLTGTWYALAEAAGVSAQGAVTLTGAQPGTTATPPGPIVEGTLRIAAALYQQRAHGYQQQSVGTEDIGVVPPPDTVVNADTWAIIGGWVHPRRPVGRP